MRSKKIRRKRKEKTKVRRRQTPKGGSKTKAYVINLDKRTDRWEQVQDRFKGSSFVLERVSAVEDPNGYLGCSLSFQKVVQMAKDNNLESVLIFEDDNKPLGDYETRWNTVKTWCDANNDWDIINGSARVMDEASVQLKYVLDNDVNLFTCSLVLNMNWIYINKSAYDKILAWKISEEYGCLDRYIGLLSEFKVYFVFPFLGVQENGFSDTLQTTNTKNVDHESRINVLTKILEDQKKTFQQGGSKVYIKASNATESEALYPILKNIYPDSEIIFEKTKDPTKKYELSVVYNDSDDISMPFLYYIGEVANHYMLNDSALNTNNIMQMSNNIMQMSNNIYSLVTTKEKRVIDMPNTVYLPMFLNVGPTIHTSNPFIREYTNNERPFLAAYIATHSPPHRDEMFKALHALDSTVDGLGSANHTKDIEMPGRNDGWWNLSKVYKDYKFGFAMENTNEDGYITEKIMNVYRGGAIPLYWGTSKVKDIFHPDSFIYLNDYPSLEEAAKDIVLISKDEERLKKMVNAPIFKKNINPDYSKYYDTRSPQWVIDIANSIKSRLNQNGDEKRRKPILLKKRKSVKRKGKTKRRRRHIVQKGGKKEDAINYKDITIGILSWKDCKTILNTLESYKKNGLLDLVNVIVYFQEIGEPEKEIAKKYNVSYLGTDKNIGIQLALLELIHNTKTSYFIHAESDFELIYDEDTVKKVLNESIKLLEHDHVDVVKLTDIENSGLFYTRDAWNNEYKNGLKNPKDFVWKLDALSYVENPEATFPNVYNIINYNYKWYLCTTKDNKWSNNIYIAKTEFMKSTIIPIIQSNKSDLDDYMNFEIAMDKYLETHSFTIARGKGLFTHNRLDRDSKCTLEDIQQGGGCEVSYFTVSTKDTPELQRLKTSAEKHGWNLDILGLEENTESLGWEDKNNKTGNYGNFSIKLNKEIEYVSKKNPEDIVLFTDAWDVICLGDCATLYERYKTFNKDLVFGAEKQCSPDGEKKTMYANQDVPFPYLNSGFFVGKAGVIKKYLMQYKGEKMNDQLFWTDIYLANQDAIALDSNATLVLNTWDTDGKYYEFANNIFTYTETGTQPLFVHANGHIKDKLDLFKVGGGKQKAYIINLANRPEKWERIQADFKDIFNLERFDAIKDEVGHRGCGKSFQALVQKAINENMDSILIMEDDCKPLEHFQERWEKVSKWLDVNDWEIFNGGAKMVSGTETTVIDTIDGDKILKINGAIHCNMIYVKKVAYQRILEWDWDKDWLIDYKYINTDKFKTLCIEPPLTSQYEGYSNTERVYKTGGKKITRKIRKKLTKKGVTKRKRQPKRKIHKGGAKNIHYITVSTKETPDLQRLVKSAKKYGWNLEVLGLELNTTNLGHSNNAKFGMKLRYPKTYIKDKNPEDIIVFSDAWDVVVSNTPELLLEKYATFKKDIVFSAENVCWPDGSREKEYDTQNEAFPYLNSGGYVGRLGTIRELLENYKDDEIDDQRFWTNMYFKHRDKIVLDTKAEIFLSMHDVNPSDFQFTDGIFTYKETNTTPVLVHGNGTSKGLLEIFTKNLQIGGNRQKVYVINLDKREEKWEKIQDDFKDSNFHLERFSAIEHENGNIGCGESFKALIRMAKKENMGHIIIMEDDCYPIGKFNERWSEIYEWLMKHKDKWEVFNGGPREEYGWAKELVYEVNKKVELYTSDGNIGTHFMCFNKSSYDRVLEWDLIKQKDLFDWYVNSRNRFKFLYVDPPIALQRDGKSNTNKSERKYSVNEKTQTRKKKRLNLNNRNDHINVIRNQKHINKNLTLKYNGKIA